MGAHCYSFPMGMPYPHTHIGRTTGMQQENVFIIIVPFGTECDG